MRLARSVGEALLGFRNETGRDVTFRLLVTRYQDEDDSLSFRNTLAHESILDPHYVVIVHAELNSSQFSRAHAVNMLREGSACFSDSCAFAVLDVDMFVRRGFFDRTVSFLSTPDADLYFPIVWSRFSPRGVQLAEIIFGPQEEFSRMAGRWRDYGYGMFAMKGSTAKRLKMDSSFVGWGGEDADLFRRADSMKMNVVRVYEPDLVHVWHDKSCDAGFVGEKFRGRCLDSKRKVFGSHFILELSEQYPEFAEQLLNTKLHDAGRKRKFEEGYEWLRSMYRYMNYTGPEDEDGADNGGFSIEW